MKKEIKRIVLYVAILTLVVLNTQIGGGVIVIP